MLWFCVYFLFFLKSSVSTIGAFFSMDLLTLSFLMLIIKGGEGGGLNHWSNPAALNQNFGHI